MPESLNEINILLTDDHELLLAGLDVIVKKIPTVNKVYIARSAKEALAILDNHVCQVVFMDYQMPDMNGAQCTREIKRKFPTIKVIAITIHADHSHVLSMFNSGAVGYLIKSATIDEIELAIRTVLNDEYYFTPEISGFLVKRAIEKLKALPSESGFTISDRETDILKLVYEEYSSKEIAERLHLSERTIDDYRKKMMDKIGARNAIGLIKFALKEGIVGDL